MQDWNLRVILHRIWGAQPLTYKSWAIQQKPTRSREVLGEADVEVLDVPLRTYIDALESRLRRSMAET